MKNEKQRKRVRRVDAKRTALGRFLCRLLGDEAGQTIMEYVVLGVMVVAAVVAIVLLFGRELRVGFNKMINAARGNPSNVPADVQDGEIANARGQGATISGPDAKN